jgi:hypothetical protein
MSSYKVGRQCNGRCMVVMVGSILELALMVQLLPVASGRVVKN